MRTLLWINHVLIVLFTLATGTYKILGGEADIDLFAQLGMTPGVVALFGLVQATAGVGLIFRATAPRAAWIVAGCNALATLGLFVGGVTTFATVSILFIGMALLETRLGGRGRFAAPR